MRSENVQIKKMLPEIFIVSIVGSIIFFSIVVGSGSLFSGYHFVDDHVTMDIYYSIQGKNIGEFFNLMIDGVKKDLSVRFRPNYFIELYIFTALFGIDFNLWMLFAAIEGVITFVILYFLSRNLGEDKTVSFLFAGLIILGPQFTPWFRPPNQENAGLMFLSITMLLITELVKSEVNPESLFYSKPYRVLCIIMGILTAFQKEAFLILLPSFLLFIAYYSVNINNTPIKKAIVKYLDIIVTYLLTLILGTAYILTCVGTDFSSYAGIDTKMEIGDIIWKTGSIIAHCRINYAAFFGFVLAVLCIKNKKENSIIAEIRKNIFIYLYAVYSIGVEIVLHIKSGMYERYYLPYVFVVMMFVVTYIIKELKQYKRIYYIYIAVLFILLLTEYLRSFNLSTRWAREGVKGEMILSAVSDELYRNEEAVMISGLPGGGEINLSVDVWERQFHKDYQFENNEEISQEMISSGNYDIILTATDKNYLDFSGYTVREFDNYMMAAKE